MKHDMATTAVESSASSSSEAASGPSPRATPSLEGEHRWQLIQHSGIAAAGEEWDAFVPPDVPHLRSGMLRAASEGQVVQDLTPVIVRRNSRPVAAALFY